MTSDGEGLTSFGPKWLVTEATVSSNWFGCDLSTYIQYILVYGYYGLSGVASPNETLTKATIHWNDQNARIDGHGIFQRQAIMASEGGDVVEAFLRRGKKNSRFLIHV